MSKEYFPTNNIFTLTNNKKVTGDRMRCPVCDKPLVVTDCFPDGVSELEERDAFVQNFSKRWGVSPFKSVQVYKLKFECEDGCINGEMNIKDYEIHKV